MDFSSIPNTIVTGFIVATVYGFALYLATLIVRFPQPKYGFCALLSLGWSLVALASYGLLSFLGTPGVIVSVALSQLVLAFFLHKVFAVRFGRAVLAVLVGMALTAGFGFLLQVMAGPAPA